MASEGDDSTGATKRKIEEEDGEGAEEGVNKRAKAEETTEGEGVQKEAKGEASKEGGGAAEAEADAAPGDGGAKGDADGGGGGDSAPETSKHDLPLTLKAGLRAKLEELIDSGKCTRAHLDAKILASLGEFAEETAIEVIQHFSDADQASMRSKSAFLAGVIKRFKQEQQGGGAMGGGSSAGGPGGGATPSFQGPPSAVNGEFVSSVQQKLDAIFATGMVQREDLDNR
jgi:hypothetical protein